LVFLKASKTALTLGGWGLIGFGGYSQIGAKKGWAKPKRVRLKKEGLKFLFGHNRN